MMSNQSIFIRHAFEHFYLGIIITMIYVMLSPLFIAWGYPGFTSLLFVELFVLTPIVVAHLFYKAQRLNQSWSLGSVIPYRNRLGKKSFLAWFAIGIVAISAVYVPLYPVGLFLREEAFAWLPEWYFNPGYGADNLTLLANIFLIGIVVDGIIGPVAEELFFRGYLLPRMSYLKGWAPLANGTFFGLYHFWQPHNLLALVAVGCILSYIVWKTKNVYLGIAIHCSINILGAVGGYFAVIGGVDIAR
jgi:membrane protease YdiL (CAAX protease family)